MLVATCGSAYVSVHAAQAALPTYAELPRIVYDDVSNLRSASSALRVRQSVAEARRSRDRPTSSRAAARSVDSREGINCAAAFRAHFGFRTNVRLFASDSFLI
jgi:hypothetical protein